MFIFSVCLFLLITQSIVSLNPCESPLFMAAPYTNLQSDKVVKLDLRWLVQNSTICMELRLIPQSKQLINRAIFGLSRDGSMVSSPPANCYLARTDVNTLKSYTINPSMTLTEETNVEWEKNSLNTSSDGAITFSLYRPLLTKGSTEVQIKNEVQHIIWAYGYGWPMKGHRDGGYGTKDVQFLSESSSSSSSPSSSSSSPSSSSSENNISTTTDTTTHNNNNDKNNSKKSISSHLSPCNLLLYGILAFYLYL